MESNNKGSIIKVGQQVYTNLYGFGVVIAIYGKQNPALCENIRGVIATGGSAEFDIAFPDRHIVKRLPEAILRGVQWQINNVFYTQEETDNIAQSARVAESEKEREEETQKEAFNREVERLKDCPEYKFLLQGRGGAKQVAANIRKELKQIYSRTKFSVTMNGYDTVNIRWEDGPTESQIEDVYSKYKAGKFDSMQDMYVHDESPFNRLYGSVSYINAKRNYSDKLSQLAIDEYIKENSNDHEVAVTLENYKNGSLYNVNSGGSFYYSAQSEIGRIRAGLKGD